MGFWWYANDRRYSQLRKAITRWKCELCPKLERLATSNTFGSFVSGRSFFLPLSLNCCFYGLRLFFTYPCVTHPFTNKVCASGPLFALPSSCSGLDSQVCCCTFRLLARFSFPHLFAFDQARYCWHLRRVSAGLSRQTRPVCESRSC